MKYTKTDFEYVAATIFQISGANAKRAAVNKWSARFSGDNPLFNKDWFKAACYGQSVKLSKKPKKLKTFTELEKETNDKLVAFGTQLSKPFHVRAKELMDKLAEKYPIGELCMGMGRSTFHNSGTFHFTEHYGKNLELVENYTQKDVDILDYAHTRKNTYPDGWTDADQKLVDELQDIFYYLTDTHFLDLMEWKMP